MSLFNTTLLRLAVTPWFVQPHLPIHKKEMTAINKWDLFCRPIKRHGNCSTNYVDPFEVSEAYTPEI